MTTIKVKRSSSQGVSPGTTDLELGELAVNTYDGKLFLKKNDGSDSIVEFNPIARDSNGNIGIGTTNPQNALDLGNATAGRGIAWGGGAGTAHYNTIWSEYSSASLILGAGLKGDTSTATFLNPFTGTYGYAAIELDTFSDDGIKFYVGADAARTKDATITPSERMRIDTSGNVGIGISSPTNNLHVNSTGNTVAKISSTFSGSTTTGLYIDTVGDTSAARLLFSKSGTTRGIIGYSHNAAANSEAITFGTAGGTERMRIDASGATITSGNLTVNNGTNNQVYLGASDGAIEITRAAGGAYIDFKNSTAEDNDVRIQESAGGIDITGPTVINGTAIIGGSSVSGGEGGEINLTMPPTTNLSGTHITLDAQTNSVRFFESGGNSRGAYIDLNTCANGATTEIWHSENDGTGSGLDADLLDGLNSSSSATASTIVARNTAADIFCRLVRSTYQDQGTPATTARIIFRNDDGTSDNFLRAMTNTGFVGWLNNQSGVSVDSATSATTAGDADTLDGQQGSYYLNYNNFTNTPTIPTNNNQLTNGAGYITSADGGNAATLDSLDSTSFARVDAASSYTNYTNKQRFYSNSALNTASGSQSSLEVYNGTAGNDAFMTFHVGGDFALYFGLDGGTNKLSVGGWSLGANSYQIWHAGNQGSTSGLDADLLDGQHGSHYLDYNNFTNTPTIPTDTNFYLDGITKSGNTLTFSVNGATNQQYTFGSNAFNSTTIPTNNNQLTNGAGYITSADGGNAATLDSLDSTSFIRSDAATNVSASTEWQDNQEVRFGNDADMRIFHDGTNGTIRSYKHGGNIYVQGENASGTNQAIAYFRGDTGVNGAQLYAFGSLKFYTTNTGAVCQGDLTATGNNTATLIRTSATNANADRPIVVTDVQNTTKNDSNLYKDEFGGFTYNPSLNEFKSNGGSFADPEIQGNLLIGDSLDMRINSSSTTGIIESTSTNMVFRSSGGGGHNFQRSGGTAIANINNTGDFTALGNVTAYGSPSDINLKENIETISNAVEKVQKLDGVTFNYKKDGGRSTGLIAQQLQEVLPEVVYTTEDLDGEEHLAVRYGNTVGLLVEAIKELKSEIEELKTKIGEV